MSGQCPWAPALFGMGKMVTLIFPVTVSRQCVCRELGLHFLCLWPASWEYPDTLSGTLVLWHEHNPKTRCLSGNNNPVCERCGSNSRITLKIFHSHHLHRYLICDRQPGFIQKSTLTFPLRPRVHAKVNVIGLGTTLWSRWITVDVQNEYIYSHMRTAIITSVCLEDKAGFMWLRLRGNSWNLMRDERKPYFLIQFKLESTAAEILFAAKWI